MEFRKCPTCEASVLDDDAQDCPFCGASMSAKPGAKPKPKPSAPSGGPAKTPAAGKTGAAPQTPAAKGPAKPTKPTAPAEPTNDDEDPFGVGTTSHVKAIPLTKAATKSRTLLVKCPMCETEGYMSPEDSGKHVRCGNAECMVPVFKSPEIKKAAAPSVEKKPGLPWKIKAGIPALVLALGGAAWFFVNSQDQGNGTLPPLDIPVANHSDTDPDEPVPVPDVPEVAQRSMQDVVNELLDGASALSDERRPAVRSHEYARQLATEILAQGHRLPAATTQYASLEKISKKTPYHRVEPLVELGWQALAENKRDEAEKHAHAALLIVQDPALPGAVRRTLDGEIAVIALLAKLDLLDLALPLLEKHGGASPRGRMAMLWTATLQGKSFNLDDEAQRVWHVETAAPVWVAVIETLVCRGGAAQAQALCSQAPGTAAQDAAFAAWGGRSLLIAEGTAIPEAVSTVLNAAETSPTTKLRLWAAVADAQLTKGDKAGATKSLEQCLALVGTLGEPSPIAIPDLATIFGSQNKPRAGLPDPTPAQAKAQALTDIAFLQTKLGQTTEGWTTLTLALSWGRGMGPSPAATQQLLDDCEKSGTKAQIMSIAPKNAKEVLVLGQYRRQCQALHDLATRRQEFQLGLLREAALRGHSAAVWQHAVARDSMSDLNEKEPFLTGERPPLLSLLMMLADGGDKTLAGEIKQYLGDRTLKPSTLDWTQAHLPGLLSAKGPLGPAAEAIRREQKESPDAKANPYLLEEVVLRSLSKAQSAAAMPAFLELIRQTEDPTLKEDAFRLYAGHLSQVGKAEQLLAAVQQDRALEVTQKLAIHLGIVESQP